MNIEEEIEKQVALLKPEIKNIAVFTYGDEEKNLASCHSGYNPPLIKFHVNIIEREWVNYLRRIITHELVHAIQHIKSEPEASLKETKLNFFTE
jgi:hypothetical protein